MIESISKDFKRQGGLMSKKKNMINNLARFKMHPQLQRGLIQGIIHVLMWRMCILFKKK